MSCVLPPETQDHGEKPLALLETQAEHTSSSHQKAAFRGQPLSNVALEEHVFVKESRAENEALA